MDIIIGSSAIDRSLHAQKLVAQIAKEERNPNHPRSAKPIGIASHLARYPHICDDCGESYWDKDEWGGSHIGCRGFTRDTGF